MVPSFVLKSIDSVIENKSIYKFLVLTINELLNWKSHIDNIDHYYICNTISKDIGIINRPKHFLPFITKTLIYDSFIVLWNRTG